MAKNLTWVGALVLPLTGCGGASAEDTIYAAGGSSGMPQGGTTSISSSTGGNAGNLGTTTGGVGSISSNDCAVPGCCAPLQFEPARSRAYLVNNQLALYLVVTAADGSKDPVQFDAQVSVAGVTQNCTGSTSGYGYGFGYLECPAIQVTALTCGQSLSIQVRLHGAQTDSVTYSPMCDQVPFGPSVTWNTTVTCPSCPTGYISWQQTCDNPSLSNCGNTTSDVHCGPSLAFLPCRCVTQQTGERVWSCAVC